MESKNIINIQTSKDEIILLEEDCKVDFCVRPKESSGAINESNTARELHDIFNFQLPFYLIKDKYYFYLYYLNSRHKITSISRELKDYK